MNLESISFEVVWDHHFDSASLGYTGIGPQRLLDDTREKDCSFAPYESVKLNKGSTFPTVRSTADFTLSMRQKY